MSIWQEGKTTNSAWGDWYQWQGGRDGKSVWEGIWCKYCVHMYVNGKMRPLETIPGMGEGVHD
jgi:hypothetical protein